MVSRLTWLRPLAPLSVACLAFCLPADVPARGALTSPGAGPRAAMSGEAATIASALGAGRQPVSIHRITATVAEVRSVDVDADGRPDLVAASDGRIRAWLNLGSGRFVEHAATHTLLRRHTAPGFTTKQRSTHTTPVALVGDRHALAPHPRVAERAVYCGITADGPASHVALGAIVAGGSRAPPPPSLS